jgi:hypothetical protein
MASILSSGTIGDSMASPPKELAPALLRLAWRKNLTVAKALQGRNGMQGL